MKRIEANDVAERLLPVLQESEGLVAAYLFGSRALVRQRANPTWTLGSS